jgi:hypothetical protein
VASWTVRLNADPRGVVKLAQRQNSGKASPRPFDSRLFVGPLGFKKGAPSGGGAPSLMRTEETRPVQRRGGSFFRRSAAEVPLRGRKLAYRPAADDKSPLIMSHRRLGTRLIDSFRQPDITRALVNWEHQVLRPDPRTEQGSRGSCSAPYKLRRICSEGPAARLLLPAGLPTMQRRRAGSLYAVLLQAPENPWSNRVSR